MSDTSSSDAKKPMEQLNDNLSEALEQLSITSDDSDESSPSLSDMPIDVVALIIERSDYKEQLKLRKVSKSLRALVDKQKPSCKKLYVFFCWPNYIKCYYNDTQVYYKQAYCFGKSESWKKYEERGATISDDYEKIAFDDIAFTLRNPKLQLETFCVDFDDSSDPCIFDHYSSNHYKKLCDILEGGQLSTRNFEIQITRPSKYRSILPFLKPGVLEKIAVSYDTRGEYYSDGKALDTLKEIALLDQWKQAKELELVYGYGSFPMEYATHFKRFHFNEVYVGSGQLIRIRNFISTHHNFEHCLITDSDYLDFPYLQKFLGTPAAPNKRTKYVSHYSIPYSDDYLEFMIFDKTIEVERKKRSS